MKLAKRLFVLSALIYMIDSAECYKILGLFPHPGKSHVDVFVAIMKGLAEKGHEVTVVSHYPRKTPTPRYKDIDISGSMRSEVESIGMSEVTGSRLEKWFVFKPLFDLGEQSCETALKVDVVQNLIKSDEKFDVIIAEFFNTDCHLGFVHKFKAPLVGLSSCTIMPYLNARFANPAHPAYIPNNFMDYSDKLTFFERVENTVMYLVNQIYFETVATSKDNAFIKKNFGEDMPEVEEIRKNSSLMLVNTQFSLSLPRPQVPAIVEIGGVHLSKPKKLPSVSIFHHIKNVSNG